MFDEESICLPQVGNYFKPARASRLMAQAQETQRASSKSLSPSSREPVLGPLTSLSCCQFSFDSTFLHQIRFTSVHILCTKNSTFSLVFRCSCLLHAFLPTSLTNLKQSPRNAKSAATRLWGNLKPVGNMRLVCGKISGKTLVHPGGLDR